jgi:TPR repeat protein
MEVDMFTTFDPTKTPLAGIGHAFVQPAPSLYDRGIACWYDLVPTDLVEAHKWFNLAAIGGDSRGSAARTSIALEMTGSELAEAQRRARRYKH